MNIIPRPIPLYGMQENAKDVVITPTFRSGTEKQYTQGFSAEGACLPQAGMRLWRKP
ncbi:MAG: hypothetical protein HY088_02790 [Ignavibacteriales bacterium]|nr:hypothetical protein [Ignavibacteriales bacterium]